jgi:hypothetical protein
MDFYKKILILIIIIIFIYIIIRLIIKRIEIKKAYEIQINKIEGYDNINVSSLQKNYDCNNTIKNDLITRLNNIKNIPNGSNIINYAIKASINSAYNGKENTTDMINYVLSRGCRFLDFQVFKDSTSGIDVVSIPNNDEYTPLDSVLNISDALNYINMYGFNSVCPNYSDPLFIQIRLKCKVSDKKSICYNINNIIKQQLNPLYKGKIDKKTSINDLLGKIIIIMDAADITYDNNIDNISQIVNLYNNNLPNMQTYLYNLLPKKNLVVNTDMYTCNTLYIKQTIFNTYTNIDSYDIFQNYSCQIIPMMFWDTGGYLCSYETLFNNCGGGIVPLSSIYYKLKNTENKYIEYPDPLFASSNYNNPIATIITIIACLGIVGFIVMRDNS